MTVIQGLLVIGALIFLALHHTRLLIENKRLWTCVEKNTDTRARNIYVMIDDSQYMEKLINLDMEVHDQMMIGIKNRFSCHGFASIEYENGDQIMVIKYSGQRLQKLPAETISNHAHRIFFDYRLPDSVFNATINDLGLTDYMIRVGVCTERSGEVGKKDE